MDAYKCMRTYSRRMYFVYVSDMHIYMYVCKTIYIYIYTYVYPHGFAHPRHRLSRASSITWNPTIGVLAPTGLPKSLKMVTKTSAISGTIHDTSVLGRILVPTWGAAGSQKAPDTNKYQNCLEKCEMVDPAGPRFMDFSVICVSWGCKWTHLRNRLFLGPCS